MYQFVKNNLVFIHEQINIIFLNYIKIITDKIQSSHTIKHNYLNIVLNRYKGIITRNTIQQEIQSTLKEV